MKKLLLLLLSIFFFNTLSAQCKDSIYVPFTNSIPTQGGTWITNSVSFGDSTRCGGTTNSCALSKPNYVEFNGLGDFIRTPLITQSATFTIWYKRSSNNTGHRVIIETSPDNSVWTTQLQITSITTTYQRASININNVFVRIRDQRDSTTSTRLWYLDDIKWTWDKSGSIWNGNVNSDWQNPANWCKGVLPTSTDSVIIPTGTPNNPVILNGVAVCRDITLNTGTQLTIQNAKLQVYGKINSISQINSLNGIVELAGSSAQTISGSLFSNKVIGSFVISNYNGVSITSDTLKIKKELLFDAYNCVLNTNGYLYLLSSDSITARIGDMTSCRIIGDVIVERFVPNHPAKWQLLSVPVIGKTINECWQESNSPTQNAKPGFGTIITSNLSNPTSLGFDGFSPGGPSMKWYNDITGTFQPVTNTNSLINTTTGYFLFVRGDRSVLNSSQTPTQTTLRTKGTIYSPIDNPPPTINVLSDTFQSVNNFYTSAINFNSLIRTGGVQNTFYLWDPSLSGVYGVGGYQTFIWNGSSYSVSPGGGSYSNGNTNIESGSAFFVKTFGNSGTLQFTETAKVEGSNVVLRPQNTPSSIKINLNKNESSLIDGVISFFGSNYDNRINIDDISKINSTFNLSILKDNRKFAAEFRKFNENDTIQLFLENLRKDTFELKFELENINPSVKIWLHDRYKNSTTEIKKDNFNYKFEINTEISSQNPKRLYYIVNKRNNLEDLETDEKSIKIYPNPFNNGLFRIQMTNFEQGNYTLLIYNLHSGRLSMKRNFTNDSEFEKFECSFHSHLTTGEYLIVIKSDDSYFEMTTKFLVK